MGSRGQLWPGSQNESDSLSPALSSGAFSRLPAAESFFPKEDKLLQKFAYIPPYSQEFRNFGSPYRRGEDALQIARKGGRAHNLLLVVFYMTADINHISKGFGMI